MTISTVLEYPHKLIPRPYQLDVWRAFFDEGKKRFINVWHRRAGKDKTWWNIMIAEATRKVGNYIYCLPEIKHAKKVIWESIDARTGIKFLDHIPESQIASTDKAELLIRLKNGSTIQLCGADNYDSLVGSNPVGIVYSEFSLCHPLSWQYLQPILAENDGWAAFIFTPRGDNHAHELYEQNLNNANWHVNMLTVDETREWDGSECVTQDAIEAARAAGMRAQMIQQEFYCSFEAALVGAYWAEELAQLLKKGHICDYGLNARYPVDTFWDLGIGDSTALWFTQSLGNNTYNLINYYENNGQRIDHYVDIVKDFKTANRVSYGTHYMPHDAKNRSIQTGMTTADYATSLGLNVCVLERPLHKADAIEAGRFILPNCRIHAENCRNGLACLRSYQASYNERLRVSGAPLHNWASHGADAFMLFAQNALSDEKVNESKGFEIHNDCVNCGEL